MSERATPPASSQLPGVWTLIRDILSFVGGWAVIFMEVSRPEIRESVLVLAGSIVGIPGLAVGGQAIAAAIRRNGTGGSPQQPVEQASSL